MNELLNPYRTGPTIGARVPVATGRVALATLLGAAVVSGCSGAGGTGPEVPATRPSMPLPTPSATPALPPAASVPQSGVPRPAQLTKPGADYTVVRGDTLSELAVEFDVPGGWPALFELNADVLWNPDLIIVGQQLDIDGRA